MSYSVKNKQVEKKNGPIPLTERQVTNYVLIQYGRHFEAK
jgi:hypothetical protein